MWKCKKHCNMGWQIDLDQIWLWKIFTSYIKGQTSFISNDPQHTNRNLEFEGQIRVSSIVDRVWRSSDPLGQTRPTWAREPHLGIFHSVKYNKSDPLGEKRPTWKKATHLPAEFRKVDLSAQFRFRSPPTAFKQVLNYCTVVFNMLVVSLMTSNIWMEE